MSGAVVPCRVQVLSRASQLGGLSLDVSRAGAGGEFQNLVLDTSAALRFRHPTD
jgi:hypothetical protein